MNENSDTEESSISKARTPDEIADYWDSHSLDTHWDQTHEVEFEVRALRPRRITVDPEIYERLKEQARMQGVTPETLVNRWLSEHLVHTDNAVRETT
jgi:hypothetical protein